MKTSNLSLTDTILKNIATLWISGHGPKAPGTWGSLVAMFLAPFAFLPLSPGYRFLVLGIVFIVGALAAARTEKIMEEKDPGCVVIDELLGLWVCYLFFPPLSPLLLAIGFVLFRIFDIQKPGHDRRCHRRDLCGILPLAGHTGGVARRTPAADVKQYRPAHPTVARARTGEPSLS
jgi:phosphatidylglycerophosphatase A